VSIARRGAGCARRASRASYLEVGGGDARVLQLVDADEALRQRLLFHLVRLLLSNLTHLLGGALGDVGVWVGGERVEARESVRVLLFSEMNNLPLANISVLVQSLKSTRSLSSEPQLPWQLGYPAHTHVRLTREIAARRRARIRDGRRHMDDAAQMNPYEAAR